MSGSDFVYELELDVEGSCVVEGHTITFSLGEVKSGRGKFDAVEQLLVRFAAIHSACSVLVPSHMEVKFRGEIFTPVKEWLRELITEDNLSSIMHSARLKPFKNVYIKCVSIV